MMTRALRFVRRVARAGREEKGSALVELGLSLPMLLTMLLGAEELARFAYTAIETANAAHAGVMYAASAVAASTDTTGIGTAATADSPNLMGSSAVSVISTTTSCSCSDGSASTCSDNSTCESAGLGLITTVTVSTQATFHPLFRLPGGPSSYTVQGKSSQVVSNQ